MLPTYLAYLLPIFGGGRWLPAICGLVGLALDAAIPRISLDSGIVQGAHSVGYVDYEVQQSTAPAALGRIFYPTLHRHTTTSNYIYHNNSHGLTRRFVETSGILTLIPFLPKWVLSHWNDIQIPVAHGVDVLAERLPVCVFSHGNTASREISTTMAVSLASAGALVVLIEHTDASSSCARYADGSVLEFDHSVAKLGTNPETIEFLNGRRAQTRIRSQNIRDALALLWRVNQGTALPSLQKSIVGLSEKHSAALLLQLKGKLNLHKVGLGGHSFGGATALHFAAEFLGGRVTGEASHVTLGGLFVMDPANSWIPDEVREDVGLGVEPGATHYWKLKSNTPAPKLSQQVATMFMYSNGWYDVGKWSQFGQGEDCVFRFLSLLMLYVFFFLTLDCFFFRFRPSCQLC